MPYDPWELSTDPMFTDPWQTQYGGIGGLPVSWWVNQNPYANGGYGGYPGYGDMALWLQGLYWPGTDWWNQSAQSVGEAPAATPPATPPNEGQTVETPQGTPPSNPGEAVPNYPTDVLGAGIDPGWAAIAALGGGAALGLGLGGLFGGYTGGQSPELAQTGPDGNPVFSTTVTGQPGQAPTQPSPIGTPQTTVPVGGGPEGYDAHGNPTWSVTGYAPPTFTGGVSVPPQQPVPLVSSPIGGLDPAQYPGIFAPTIPSPIGGLEQPPAPAEPAQPPNPQAPQQPGASTGGGGVSVPASFPTLQPHAPISSLFAPLPLPTLVPGLNDILRGRI